MQTSKAHPGQIRVASGAHLQGIVGRHLARIQGASKAHPNFSQCVFANQLFTGVERLCYTFFEVDLGGFCSWLGVSENLSALRLGSHARKSGLPLQLACEALKSIATLSLGSFEVSNV